MCVVIPLDNGKFQAYCIACHWSSPPKHLDYSAANAALRHDCADRRKRG